jgi:hypothetical protein
LAAAAVPAVADTCKTAAGVPVTVGAGYTGDQGAGDSFGRTAAAGGLVTTAGMSMRPADRSAAAGSAAAAAADGSTNVQQEQRGSTSSAWGTSSTSSSHVAAGGLVTSSTSSKYSPRAGSLAQRLGLPQSAAATYAPFVSAVPGAAPYGSKGSSSRLQPPAPKGPCALQVLQQHGLSVLTPQLVEVDTCMGAAAYAGPGWQRGAAASSPAPHLSLPAPHPPPPPPPSPPATAIDPRVLLDTAVGQALRQRLAVRWLLPNWAAVSWLRLVLQQLMMAHVELLLVMAAGKLAHTPCASCPCL